MIILLLLRQAAAYRLPFGVGRKREAKSLFYLSNNRMLEYDWLLWLN